MSTWIKIIRPNVEVGGNFVIYQTVIIDLEHAAGFAMQNPTNLAFFVDGKTFVVQQQLDAKAFQTVLAYAQQKTGQSLT
ncbi:MAG: hypothetical protein ABI835_12490 [Chloroflexota bacterium]